MSRRIYPIPSRKFLTPEEFKYWYGKELEDMTDLQENSPIEENSCVNCEKSHTNRSVFCGDECKHIAECIRLFRKWCTNSQKQTDPYYPEVFLIRLAKLASARVNSEQIETLYQSNRIPDHIRKQVWERDKGICVECGKPGKEIDHIIGPSFDINNLRLTCHMHNMDKALDRIRPAGNFEQIIIAALMVDIKNRVDSEMPIRICDNEQMWAKVWRRWPNLFPGDNAYSPINPRKYFSDIKEKSQEARIDFEARRLGLSIPKLIPKRNS
jgi:hypothetical protein